MAAPRNTTYELIYHIGRGNVKEKEIPQVLSAIFDAPDYKHSIRRLREQDLTMWVERLDQIIDSAIYPEELRKRTLRSLRKICGSKRVLPRSHYFRGRLSKAGKHPVFGGNGIDVWRVEDNQKRVYAARVFRVNMIGDEHKMKWYFEEVTVWKRLNHPNVLPNLGASPDIAEFCVVSPWMPEGDLLQYLKNHPGANRVSIMIGVADGLSYLHSNDVVHGDLKGLNIRFNGAGAPFITDFGLFSMGFDPQEDNDHLYNIRWMAPEILEAENVSSGRPTKMSDVYSFAIVVIEIFTGNVPFPDLSGLNIYYLVVKKGKRPPKPTDARKLGLSSGAWKLVQKCWNEKRDERPDMQYVADRLRGS